MHKNREYESDRFTPPSAHSNVQPPPTRGISSGILFGRDEGGLTEQELITMRVHDIAEAHGDNITITSLLRTWHLRDTQVAHERGRSAMLKQVRCIYAELIRVFDMHGIPIATKK